MSVRGCVPIIAVALVIAACSGPTEPDVPNRVVNPALKTLAIDPAEVRNGGALVVHARFADPGFTLAPQERISFTASTGSGEVEQMLAGPEVCPLANGDEYTCDSFSFGVRTGTRASAYTPYLDRIGGRFTYIALGDSAASVRIFDGDLSAAMAKARKWPNVRFVERNAIYRLMAGTPMNGAIGAARLDFAAPRASDGTLQVQPQETVTVRYRQPDGSQVVSSIQI